MQMAACPRASALTGGLDGFNRTVCGLYALVANVCGCIRPVAGDHDTYIVVPSPTERAEGRFVLRTLASGLHLYSSLAHRAQRLAEFSVDRYGIRIARVLGSHLTCPVTGARSAVASMRRHVARVRVHRGVSWHAVATKRDLQGPP